MTRPRGFTIFFAVLVASLSLAVGLAIYDLLIRELELSQTATQSQYAIYAADAGAECALYWDSKYTDDDKSAFGTSSTDSWGSSVFCNTQEISTTWDNSQQIPTAATTTFQLLLDASESGACAVVTVAKNGNPSQTRLISRGYNTCAETGVERLERAFKVTY